MTEQKFNVNAHAFQSCSADFLFMFFLDLCLTWRLHASSKGYARYCIYYIN